MKKSNCLDQKIFDMNNIEEEMILTDKIDLEIIKDHIETIVTNKYFVKKHTEIEMIVRTKILIKEINFKENKMMIGMIEGEREEVVRVKIFQFIKNKDFKMKELRILNRVIRRKNLKIKDKKVVFL